MFGVEGFEEFFDDEWEKFYWRFWYDEGEDCVVFVMTNRFTFLCKILDNRDNISYDKVVSWMI